MGFDDQISNLNTIFNITQKYLTKEESSCFMKSKITSFDNRTPSEVILNDPNGFSLVKTFIEDRNQLLWLYLD